MKHSGRGTAWLRATSTALLAIFALPSCLTMAMWRSPDHAERDRFRATIAAPDADQGNAGSLQFAVHPLGEAELVRELWQPTLAADEWLVVRPLAHPDAIVRLLQEVPQRCALHLLGEPGSGAAPRCWFHCNCNDGPPAPPLDEFASRGLFKSYEVNVPCTVERGKAPPADASPRAFAIATCRPGDSTAARIIVTPISLAADVLLSPLELLTLPAWW